jgi:hypothetical protein
MLTNRDKNEYDAGTGDIVKYPTPGKESAGLGYETTDVNVSGAVVFLGGLFGFVLIFFVFCFLMGRVINEALNKQDGPVNRWHETKTINAGGSPELATNKRENLKSNAAMEQQGFQQMATQFPQPRLQMDDGNQDISDLHSREDLLLEHYSVTPGEHGIRIPIDRAMQLIAERGLPAVSAPASQQKLAFDKELLVSAPLTSGFARTGYELDQMEARQQKLDYGKAERNTHAELQPLR